MVTITETSESIEVNVNGRSFHIAPIGFEVVLASYLDAVWKDKTGSLTGPKNSAMIGTLLLHAHNTGRTVYSKAILYGTT